MRKVKKILLLSVLFVGGILYVARVWHVNRDVKLAVTKEYAKGEAVAFEDDFIHSADTNSRGYSLQILDSQIYKRQDFIDTYNIKAEIDSAYAYLYVVDVKAYNTNKVIDTDHGIQLWFTPLVSLTDYIVANSSLTLEVNETLPDMSFALRAESDMDIKIIYPILESNYKDMEALEKEDFSILISEYPTRKLLNLK